MSEKYKVGDVIAFRWTGKTLRKGEVGKSFTFADSDSQGAIVFCDHRLPVDSPDAYILERIDGATIMDPKDPLKGWTVRTGNSRPGDYYSRGTVGALKAGGVYEGCGLIFHDLSGHGGCDAVILTPPAKSPCPELLAKIETLSSDMKSLERDMIAKGAELLELKRKVQG